MKLDTAPLYRLAHGALVATFIVPMVILCAPPGIFLEIAEKFMKQFVIPLEEWLARKGKGPGY